MEPNEFSHSSFDDIVFEGRNKGYGAYRLRRLEARDILFALLIGSFLMAMLIFGPLTYKKYFGKAEEKKIDTTEVYTPPVNLAPKPRGEKKPPVKQEIVKVKMEKFVAYKPRIDNEVPESPRDSLPERPGPDDQEGPEGPIPPDPGGMGGEGDPLPPDEIFTFVDENPRFKEGNFKDFIEKNYLFTDKMYEKGKPGTIHVSFTLEKDGTVTDVKILKTKGLTPEQDAEAIRVIHLSSGKWTPGKVNGEPVRMYFKQTFSFGPELFE